MIKRYIVFGNTHESAAGDWVKYDDIKHLLECSDNSDSTKCLKDNGCMECEYNLSSDKSRIICSKIKV